LRTRCQLASMFNYGTSLLLSISNA
jgi:hypothetical protein